MLVLDTVNQYYGQSHTLRDLSLDIPAGECTVIMGRNGVGKTTLLQSIMGINPLASGRIMLDGQPIQGHSVEARPTLGLGYVPQGRQIFPLLSVQENLDIGLPMRPRGQRQIPSYIFELFPVLKDMLARRGGDLSGGQQQQLAIARALVIDPKVLLLDEPTEGIQPNVVAEIAGIIQKLNKDMGMTVVLVEQKLPFARKLADRFCILDRGQTVAQGPMDALTGDQVKAYLTV